MGKKKSVVLITLITIVIAVFCAISAIPSFALKNSVKIWTPAAAQYDLATEFGGGYYTHYYPEGVISKLEYDAVLEEKSGDPTALEEYEKSYERHGGIYLSTEEDDNVLRWNNQKNAYEITDEFKASFEEVSRSVAKSYAAMGYSAFRVSVQDDYSLFIEIPASAKNAGTALQYFSYTGEFNLTDGTTKYFPEEEEKVSSCFKGFSVKSSQGNSFIKISLTKAGVKKVAEITETISSGTLYFNIGDNSVLSLSVSGKVKAEDKALYISAADSATASVLCTALNSALRLGDPSVQLKKATSSDVGNYAPVFGKNQRTLFFVAVLLILLVSLIVPIVLYKGYGVAMAFSTMLYFGVAAFCFAFITESVFEVSVASAIVFVLGLFTHIFLSARAFKAIKKEVAQGKTVESSVKAGHKKSLLTAVDICSVAFGVSAFFAVGSTALKTVAIQAVICFGLTAFAALLFTRMMNYLLLSCAKDKYKFFRFVREDDDDE